MQNTIASTANHPAAQATTTPASGNIGIGSKNMFLKLLVAQMQYQNPLKPQDPTQMTAQLSRFNMVEQQLKTNKLLGEIAAANTSTDTQAATAAAYLGHQAVMSGDQLHYDGATPEQIAVQATQSAANATVRIVNASGQTVKTLYAGALNKGATQLTWDGTLDNGNPASVGDYHIEVTATDANGAAVTTSTRVTGQVQAVRITSAGVKLVVGGIPIDMAKIAEIRL